MNNFTVFFLSVIESNWTFQFWEFSKVCHFCTVWLNDLFRRIFFFQKSLKMIFVKNTSDPDLHSKCGKILDWNEFSSIQYNKISYTQLQPLHFQACAIIRYVSNVEIQGSGRIDNIVDNILNWRIHLVDICIEP